MTFVAKTAFFDGIFNTNALGISADSMADKKNLNSFVLLY